MNMSAVGVVSSSSRLSGVCATKGRSPSTTSFWLLPASLSGARLFCDETCQTRRGAAVLGGLSFNRVDLLDARTAMLAVEEWVLPAAARRRARRIGGFKVVQNDFAILVFEGRHSMPRGHERDGLVPLPAIHALLRHQLEVVTGGAAVEGLIAAGAGRELF